MVALAGRSRGIKPTIPSYLRRARNRPKRGRPVKVGPGYAERWKVERTFAWLGNFRRLLVRHERYLFTFRAFLLVAFILVSLRCFGSWASFPLEIALQPLGEPHRYPAGRRSF